MMRNGFSLIELMVVIAIVALLAAVAMPSYTKYVVISQATNAITTLSRVANDLTTAYYTTGSFPASITVNGVTIASPSWGYVNMQNIVGFSYAMNSTGVQIQASISGINGIPGYVTPTSGSLYTTASVVTLSLYYNGTSMSMACGQYGYAQDIPLAYLPGGCQCTAVTMTGGAICPH